MKLAEKKKPGRFTIQFNVGDPQQKTVCDLLEQQGRRKAQYISNAILHYIHCPETPEIPMEPIVDRKLLEELVHEALKSEQVQLEIQNAALKRRDDGQQEKGRMNTPDSNAAAPWGERDFAAIASTLAAFKRK